MLLNSLGKSIFSGLMLCLSAFAVSAEAPPTRCNSSISKNCECTMPLLVREMGAADSAFLVDIWNRIHNNDPHREELSRARASEILSVSFRYRQVKYFIASRCGVLAFEDGNE